MKKEVSDREYKKYIDKNIVSYKRLVSIARKIVSRTKLTLEETAIFEGKTTDINNIIIKFKNKEKK
jgi:hypothetical protein